MVPTPFGASMSEQSFGHLQNISEISRFTSEIPVSAATPVTALASQKLLLSTRMSLVCSQPVALDRIGYISGNAIPMFEAYSIVELPKRISLIRGHFEEFNPLYQIPRNTLTFDETEAVVVLAQNVPYTGPACSNRLLSHNWLERLHHGKGRRRDSMPLQTIRKAAVNPPRKWFLRHLLTHEQEGLSDGSLLRSHACKYEQ
jgi:hypothetical protein